MRDLEYIDMAFGEKKKISILSSSSYGETFEITNAKFSLCIGNVEESSGECEIKVLNDSESILSSAIEALRKNAVYRLSYWYDIYPKQRLNYDCLVRVM